MKRATPNHSLWRSGVLALVPVVGLALVGLESLRRDQAEVQANAQRELAGLSNRFAEAVASWIGAEFAQTPPAGASNSPAAAHLLIRWRINPLGEPLDFVVQPDVPTPPAWWLGFDSEGRAAYRRATAQPPEESEVVASSSSLPTAARPALSYEASRTLSLEQSTIEAVLEPLLDQVGQLPSGLSVAEAAAWRLFGDPANMTLRSSLHALGHYLERELPGTWPELREALRKRQTADSEQAPTIDRLIRSVDQRQRELGLLARFQKSIRTPLEERPSQWLTADGEHWYPAVSSPDGVSVGPTFPTNSPTLTPSVRASTDINESRHLVFLPRAAVTRGILEAAGRLQSQLPNYARLRVSLGGEEFDTMQSEWKSASVASRDPSALAAFDVTIQDFHLAGRAGAEIADTSLLFAGYRRRASMVAGLILAAVGISGLGFWQMRRAYLAQEKLAEQQANFVASVSHELRAPVASVGLMVESLRRGTEVEPVRRENYLRLISQECRRLAQLIQNVLAVGRMNQGRWEYVREPFDFRNLVIDTVARFQPLAEEQHVRIDLEVLPEVPSEGVPLEITGDSLAWQQALTNLLDNALKHSAADGRIVVQLAVAPATSGPNRTTKNEILLSVIDAGPGVPSEDRERIFEPFYRRGSELRRETQGIGLGLALVRLTVAAHGGHVRCEVSPAGKGARFEINIPYDSISPNASPARSTAATHNS